MRSATVILALCQAALLAACSESNDPATAADAATAPSALARSHARPISGGCRSSFELTNFEFLPPPDEETPTRADYTDAGTCHVSHLGLSTIANSGSIDFTVVPAHASGTFTLTAANGDRLEGTEETDFPAPDENGLFAFNGVQIITGGTGRFAGAHGVLSVTGTGSTETSTIQPSVSGRIEY